MCIRDRFWACFAHVVPSKGAANDWVVRRVVEDIEKLGHTDIVLKSDGEPAIREVQDKIRLRREFRTVVENSPVKDSQANGFIERANGLVKEQVTTLKDALDTRLGEKVPPQSAVLTWLVEYSATLLSRYAVGKDGKTAYERIRGR